MKQINEIILIITFVQSSLIKTIVIINNDPKQFQCTLILELKQAEQ